MLTFRKNSPIFYLAIAIEMTSHKFNDTRIVFAMLAEQSSGIIHLMQKVFKILQINEILTVNSESES